MALLPGEPGSPCVLLDTLCVRQGPVYASVHQTHVLSQQVLSTTRLIWNLSALKSRTRFEKNNVFLALDADDGEQHR